MKINMLDYKPKESIKIFREWEELTQKDFAKLIGKTKRTIQSYEQGENNYNIITFLKIAKTCGYEVTVEKKNNNTH